MFTLSLILLFASTAAFAQENLPNSTGKKQPLKQTEQIVVTGTYAPVPLNEVDRSVTSLEINQSPTQYRNALDVLYSDSSVDVRQRASGMEGILSIRGSSAGQTLILVDGLRLNDEQTSNNNLDLPFPFSSLQRIEVLKGSGSTLYGSDAVGGAVNFITGVPAASEIKFSAAGGNYGTNQQNGSIAFVSPKKSEQLTFTRELSTGFMPDRDYRTMAFGSESILDSAAGQTHVLLGLSDRPFGAAQFYGDYPAWERTKGWFAGATQELGSKTQAAFGYRRHTDLFDLFRYDPAIYENNHITNSWQAALRRHEPVTSNTGIFYGAEGYRDSIVSNNLGRHQRDRGAVYADFDARALRRFSLSAGAREELFTGGDSQFSPSVSGGYWLNTRIKFRASISSAFRLPTYTDLYYSDPANKGNPNLKPESAWNYEGGTQINFGRQIFDLAVFQRREKDDIDYVRANATGVWQAENIDKLNFTGVETSLRLRIGEAQQLNISYTGLHGAQTTSNAEQSKYTFEHPVHSGILAWQGELPQGITTRLRLNVIDRYRSDPYPVLELAVEHSFGYVKPFLELTNLTNTGYEEIPGVRMQGRAILAGIQIRIIRK